MKLMILTAEVEFAQEAQAAGIDRIFFDLEYINKIDRQRGRDTVISNNSIEDIPSVKKVLTSSKLLVRVNPIHQYSKLEIEKVIKYGADIIMLPMVCDASDVKTFVKLVGGRAKTCIMIESTQALTRINNILNEEGIDEIFIGLNDLHIGLGLTFMFEALSGGIVEYLAEKCKNKGIPFGFGGIARIGEGALPAEKILGEHVRLGSSSVILSRTFKGKVGESIDLKEEVNKVRESIDEIMCWQSQDYVRNLEKVKMGVSDVVKMIEAKSE